MKIKEFVSYSYHIFISNISIGYCSVVEYADCISADRVRNPCPPNECLGYDTKQSDGGAPVILELWEMQSTPSLPLLPGPFGPRMVAPDRILSMGQIDQFDI